MSLPAYMRPITFSDVAVAVLTLISRLKSTLFAVVDLSDDQRSLSVARLITSKTKVFFVLMGLGLASFCSNARFRFDGGFVQTKYHSREDFYY